MKCVTRLILQSAQRTRRTNKLGATDGRLGDYSCSLHNFFYVSEDTINLYEIKIHQTSYPNFAIFGRARELYKGKCEITVTGT